VAANVVLSHWEADSAPSIPLALFEGPFRGGEREGKREGREAKRKRWIRTEGIGEKHPFLYPRNRLLLRFK